MSQPTRPHSLVRLSVYKSGTDWEVDVGNPDDPLFTSAEWDEAQAEAQRVAARWRTHYTAFGWG